MKPIETVLLDMGNVLIFHDNSWIWEQLAQRCGLPPAQVDERLSRSVLARANRGELDGEQLGREIGEQLGIRFGAGEFEALWNSHFEVNRAVLPHVEALLQRTRVMLLSNTNELHAQYCLRELPILQRFEALLFSHELGCAKPEPAIFERALARAGSAPEATVFFDDLPPFLAAARALGIRAELFSSAAEFPAQLRRLGLGSARA